MGQTNPSTEQMSNLPAPPHMQRSIMLTTLQRLGIPLLLAIPILALLGVFGEHFTTAQGRSAMLEASVSYADRMHYRQPEPLYLTVRNISPDTLDTVTVAFDTTYINSFVQWRFIPQASYPYHVILSNLAPRETRQITVEFEGERYWRTRGTITIAARRHGTPPVAAAMTSMAAAPMASGAASARVGRTERTDRLRLAVSTWIFP